jgi:hypothetical protein
LGTGVITSFAQPFRVVTWQVDALPPAKEGATNTPADEQRYTDVASTLGATDADVIVLYGVPDSDSGRKIAGLIKTKKFSLSHHAAFRHGGSRNTVAGAPVAILTRRQRMAGKTVEWSHTGRIDLAGGFAFTVFRHGPTAFCLYVATLPGALTNGVSGTDGKYFARKREYAAEYLSHHATWLATTYTNEGVATYVTGDFQLAPKGPVNDRCAKVLEAAGFRALSPGTATDKSPTSITNSAALDRVQDPIFTKGVEFVASRQITRPAPEHAIVVCDLTFKTPAVARPATPAKAAPAPAAGPAPAPIALVDAPARPPTRSTTPAPKPAAPVVGTSTSKTASLPVAATAGVSAPGLPLNSGRIWIWTAGSALALSLLGWWIRARASAQRLAAVATPKKISAPHFLELQTSEAVQAPAMPEASVLRESSTATGQTDRVPWDDPAVRPGGAPGYARMTPHLRQLMRDVVVAWLSRQRTHLLESHERGTEQVLELQAQVERIKVQFQERLRSQQQRIADLDAALRGKEKVILDLVRARRPEAGG